MCISSSRLMHPLCLGLLLLAGLLAALTLPVGPVRAAFWQVNTAADVADGSCSDGACSLRDALQLAAPGDEITFAPALAGQTILLADELYINKRLTISAAVPITISGNQAHRVFRIGPAGIVTLSHLAIINGLAATGQGGGIYVDAGGHLTVDACRIAGNQAMSGGGIFSSGAVTITHSTVTDNSADSFGGGLQGTGGVVAVEQSTFHANRAVTGGGGGLNVAVASLTLRNSTVSGNTTGGPAGSAVSVMSMGWPPEQTMFTMTHSTLVGAADREVVLFLSGHVWMYNSIVANQGAPTQWSCGLLEGEILANEGNLVQDDSCNAAYAGDPRLGPLADNGGATWTHLPDSGSPAPGKAAPAYCLPTDQRGQSRPAGAGCDIGAVEVSETAGAKIYLPLLTRGSLPASSSLSPRR